MYLHLGKDTAVKYEDIIGIFDMDNTTISKKCRKYLSNKEKHSKIIFITQKLPKSFIVCSNKGEETIYVSQLLTSTLLKRIKNVF